MVEDEFLATAQTFTRHLHHAEYQRLRKEARERNTSNISNISRPTDGATHMREELRKRKEAQSRQAKVRRGVNDMLASARKTGKQGEESESDDDMRESDEDEPWRGTQLHSFMTRAPRHDLKSLTGIQGLKSRTRAAAGFRKTGAHSQSPPSFKNVRRQDGEDSGEETVSTTL